MSAQPIIITGEDNPARVCSDYEEQMPDWEIVNDCFNGTRAIVRAGVKYLPQNAREPDANYERRLARSVFWNAYHRTLLGLVGLIFRKDPEFASDVPQQIQDDWENLDLQGTHGDVFLKDLCTKQINDGHAFIFVDHPPMLTNDAGEPRSDVTAEEAMSRRPFWKIISKSDVLNWRYEFDDGLLNLTQVTIREWLIEHSGLFSEEKVAQYRVLRPGSYTVYREEADEVSGETTYIEIENGLTSLDAIPLVAVYSKRAGFMRSTPPLLDLALENIRHYRLRSDLDHILHVANVPILVRVGAPDEAEDLIVGGGAVVDVVEGGDLKYCEHNGNAIGKAQEEIDKAKDNMAALGLLLLARKAQVQRTATEATLDYESETSELATMARALQDGVEQALDFHAQYKGLPEGGSVEINTDFAKVQMDAQKLGILASMAGKSITLETLWQLMERAEELPDDFDPEAERAALDKEQATANVANLKIAAAGSQMNAGRNFMAKNGPSDLMPLLNNQPAPNRPPS